MKQFKNIVLSGIIAGTLLTPNIALSGSTNLENRVFLEGCSPHLIEEFEFGSGIYGTNPYQRLIDTQEFGEESSLITGMSPGAEEMFMECLFSNGQNWENGIHYLGLSLCDNLARDSRIISQIPKYDRNFCLYEYIEPFN
ncbi:MAG: hypothetical protein LAT82_04330 [Nanoarchaeota archaeon]|nr:hypothetical protein [Nanoarchaeota archaeon]